MWIISVDMFVVCWPITLYKCCFFLKFECQRIDFWITCKKQLEHKTMTTKIMVLKIQFKLIITESNYVIEKKISTVVTITTSKWFSNRLMKCNRILSGFGFRFENIIELPTDIEFRKFTIEIVEYHLKREREREKDYHVFQRAMIFVAW